MPASFTHSFIFLLFHKLLGRFQFDQIEKRIRITGEHAGAAGPVHGFFTALTSLAVMMAVDHRHAQLCTHLIKLVAEVRHLVRAVLVTSDDLIDRINNNSNIILFSRPPDQHGRQFIHRPGLSTQVPDIYILKVLWIPAQRLIHITETMQAAGPVQL